MVRGRTSPLVLVAILLAGCGSTANSGSAATTAANPASTIGVAAPAATLATIPATSPPTTAGGASITPFVVCYDTVNGTGEIEPQNDGFYFGYENSGPSPVVIDTGAANQLVSTWAGDHPLVPTVFAPGRVPVAFLAIVDTAEELPAWTVVGPDGTARTAQVTGDEPPCTPELLTPPAPDTRAPTLDLSVRGLPDGAVPPTELEFSATLSGVPDLSVCPPGLDPRPVAVEITDGTTTTQGMVGTFTLPVTTVLGQDYQRVPGAGIFLTTRVIDQCASGATVSRSWPVNGELALLLDGQNVCAKVDGSTVDKIGCAYLPATGGVRIGR